MVHHGKIKRSQDSEVSSILEKRKSVWQGARVLLPRRSFDLLFFSISLVLLSFVTYSTSTNYAVQAFLPLSSPIESLKFAQWVMAARMAASDISNRWGPSDTLTIDFYDHRSSRSLIEFLGASAMTNTSVKAILTDQLGASVLPGFAAHWQLPVLVVPSSPISSASGAVGLSTYTFHPQAFLTKTLSALLDKYDWDKFGLVYTTDTTGFAIQSTVAALPNKSIELISLSVDDTSTVGVIQAILRKSLHVVVFTNRPTIQMTSFLASPYTQKWLENGSAAIIYMNQVDSVPTFLPQGSLVINSIDAVADNTTAFLAKFNAWTSNSLTSLSKGTITVYDAVFTLGLAIESAVGFGPDTNIPPGSINASMSVIDYYGYGGRIRFDPNGTRREQFSNIFNVNVSNSEPNVSMRYDGSTLQELRAPIFPGHQTSPPDDSLLNIPIVTLLALTGNVIPSYAIQGYTSMYSYFIYWINRQPGILPPNTRLLDFVIDNQNLPSNAVIEGNNAHLLGAAAIYGDFTATMTAVVQSVVSSFNIPHLTNVASPFLSNKRFYPTSMRLISSSVAEGQAIVAMAQNWGWSELTLITTSDGFGEQVFQGLAASNDITIAHNIVLDPENSAKYQEIMEILWTKKPRVIVALISIDAYAALVRAMYVAQFKPVAVITNAVLSTNLTILAGLINVPVEYLEGWVTLAVPHGKGPAWEGFLQDVQNSPLEFAPGRPYIAGLVGSATEIDAFQVIAHSIRNVIEAGGDPVDGTQLLPAMRSYNGTLFSGYVGFDERGDRIPTYEIYNSVNNLLVSVGTYSSVTGLQLQQAVVWPDGSTNIPLAILPRRREWLKWSDGAGIALAIVAAIGIITSLCMLCAIYAWRQSPVILTATWQFLIVMLLGAALGFGSTFTWIGEPTPWICALRIWIPPNGFLLIIAPLMAKTWRLWKIFTLSDLKITPVPLSKLVFIVAALVLGQIIICIFWISLGTVQTTILNDASDSNLAFVVCSSNIANRVCSYVTYGYICSVLLVGCYLAFKVRKLPKDFNESQWIGRTMYNTFLFAGLIIILGYALNKQIVVVLILICVCTMAICYGSMFLMMAPKIYTLIKHPEKRSSSSEGSTKTTDFTTRRTHVEMSDRSKSKDSHGYSSPGTDRRRSKDISVASTPASDRSIKSKDTNIPSTGTSPSSPGNAGRFRSRNGKEEEDGEDGEDTDRQVHSRR